MYNRDGRKSLEDEVYEPTAWTELGRSITDTVPYLNCGGITSSCTVVRDQVNCTQPAQIGQELASLSDVSAVKISPSVP